MKKTVLIAFAASLTFLSCKKNEQADQLVVDETTSTAPAAAPTNTQDDLIAKAKSKPLTNVALGDNFFDFGKIKKGEKVQHTYQITNTGTNPLIISEVKPGCGCTAPSFTKDPIMPGKTGEVTLSFDSSSFEGLVNKEASVYANVEKAPIILTFTADIQK